MTILNQDGKKEGKLNFLLKDTLTAEQTQCLASELKSQGFDVIMNLSRRSIQKALMVKKNFVLRDLSC